MIETPKQLHKPKIDNVCMNAIILNQQLRITTCTVPLIYMLTSRCMSYTQAQNIRCTHIFFIFLKTSPPLNLLLPSSPKSEQIHV